MSRSIAAQAQRHGRPIDQSGRCYLYPAVYTNIHWPDGSARAEFIGICDRDSHEVAKKFVGTLGTAKRQFEKWADAMNTPEQEEQEKNEVESMTTPKPVPTQHEEIHKALPEKLYALAYKRGNTTRYVMAFESMDEACDAASVSEKALDVAGVDGEYTVDEIPVRWSR